MIKNLMEFSGKKKKKKNSGVRFNKNRQKISLERKTENRTRITLLGNHYNILICFRENMP